MNHQFIPVGARYAPDSTTFIVWSPFRSVELLLTGPAPAAHRMERDERGYWRCRAQVAPGSGYLFRLDGKDSFPDPASLQQPTGVHGPSAVVDLSRFRWEDEGWTGIPLANMIIYELHAGVFTPSHDFDGIVTKLDHLADLGVNAIELMPLAQFPGNRNWGYDGAYPFAIQHSYGGADGFRRLVNAAHQKGIAVVVDVVYNHFGPEGNYLAQYGPYFNDQYRTPWGSAINFDGAWSDEVRHFFFENARLLLEDFRVDALRLDAVHAMKDFSAIPFVQQLKELASEIQRRTGRHKLLIAELDLNDPRYIHPPAKGGYGLDGQWVDEFHHALRTLLTGDRKGYYEDFGEMDHLERAFRNSYVYDGVYSAHRHRTFGSHADACPYDQFVVFDQNHDQVGNRACGDRLTANLTKPQLRLAAAAVLLSPYVPLLFMGEEYAERNPFPYFVSFDDPALIKAVREGRAREFAGFAGGASTIPDPESPETFERAVLSWDIDQPMLDFYKELIRLRKTRPALQGRTRDTMVVHPAIGNVLVLERKILSDQVWIFLHLGAGTAEVENRTGQALRPIFGTEALDGRPVHPGEPVRLAPWSATVFEIQM
ncbi:MAG TPA: malto-oligosyltrehalose trehalohydrolase [Puia sp.]|nr:malto-oligosyltrehalose trehalohydrolase [Puia sp.]